MSAQPITPPSRWPGPVCGRLYVRSSLRPAHSSFQGAGHMRILTYARRSALRRTVRSCSRLALSQRRLSGAKVPMFSSKILRPLRGPTSKELVAMRLLSSRAALPFTTKHGANVLRGQVAWCTPIFTRWRTPNSSFTQFYKEAPCSGSRLWLNAAS